MARESPNLHSMIIKLTFFIICKNFIITIIIKLTEIMKV